MKSSLFQRWMLSLLTAFAAVAGVGGLWIKHNSDIAAADAAIRARDKATVTQLIQQARVGQQARQATQIDRAIALRETISGGASNLTQQRKAAQQIGILLEPGQLQKPLPPQSQNAALVYDQLTFLLKNKPLKLLPFAAMGMNSSHTYTTAQIAQVQALLKRRSDVMNLVHQAVDKPRCVFVHDWSVAMLNNASQPELQTIRMASRLLQIESYLLARQGKYEAALSNQARGFHMATQVSSAPGVLSYLVSASCRSVTLTGLESILSLAGPNAAVTQKIQDILTANKEGPSLRQALLTEPALMEPLFQAMRDRRKQGFRGITSFWQGMSQSNAKTGSPTAPAVKVASPEEQKLATGLTDAQEADYLRQMRRLISASDLPESSRTAAYSAILEEIQKEGPNDSVHLISVVLIPGMGALSKTDTRIRSHYTEIFAAAFVLSDKAKTGNYPDKLPQEFTDPYTGKPLGYRREGANGFVDYSAGPTGTFDGGKSGEKMPPGEIVFRYPVEATPVPPDMLK